MTRLLACACFWVAAVGHAEPASDAAILGQGSQSARIDEFRLRLTSFYQEGLGYQSKAGTLA
ncbi:MAG TPA: hypothetical protein VGJ91_13170, partial [Polyangiaceae bacterium]